MEQSFEASVIEWGYPRAEFGPGAERYLPLEQERWVSVKCIEKR